MECSAAMCIGPGSEKLVEGKTGDRHLCNLAVGWDAGHGSIEIGEA